MKVLLINPTRTGNDSYISLPLHLVYIATALVEEVLIQGRFLGSK